MRIGFDLDKVFVDYPPFVPDRLVDKLYKRKANGVLEYRIPNKPDQLFRSFTHLPFFRPPIQKNIAVLHSLPKEQHQLFLISSRYGFLRRRTEALTKRLGLDQIFHKMYFNYENKQPHLFKNSIIKKLNLDMYIDDDLHLLNFVARRNPKTQFFWLQHALPDHPLEKNVKPISALSEMLLKL